jgi:fructokinase
MPDPLRLGVDLGGTKIEVAALGADGAFRLRRRVPTPRGRYDDTVAAIVALVREAERELGAAGTVGVGIPGAISARTGRVKNANSTWLNGRPLREDLCAALGREVRVANDANCLAVSEATDGAAAGCGLVFAAILGTGVGAGIAVGARVHAGANGIAGEWGHVPLPAPHDDERPGPRCWCGRDGCIEAWISGPALAADHARRGGARGPAEDGGGAHDAAAIAAAAAAGDPEAAASVERWLDRPVEPGPRLPRTARPDRTARVLGRPGHADPAQRARRLLGCARRGLALGAAGRTLRGTAGTHRTRHSSFGPSSARGPSPRSHCAARSSPASVARQNASVVARVARSSAATST